MLVPFQLAGDLVWVVGSIPSLGCWKPESGIKLLTDAAKYPIWTGLCPTASTSFSLSLTSMQFFAIVDALTLSRSARSAVHSLLQSWFHQSAKISVCQNLTSKLKFGSRCLRSVCVPYVQVRFSGEKWFSCVHECMSACMTVV